MYQSGVEECLHQCARTPLCKAAMAFRPDDINTNVDIVLCGIADVTKAEAHWSKWDTFKYKGWTYYELLGKRYLFSKPHTHFLTPGASCVSIC